MLQVHDELVFEVKNDLVDEIARIIKKEMENVYQQNILILDLI